MVQSRNIINVLGKHLWLSIVQNQIKHLIMQNIKTSFETDIFPYLPICNWPKLENFPQYFPLMASSSNYKSFVYSVIPPVTDIHWENHTH